MAPDGIRWRMVRYISAIRPQGFRFLSGEAAWDFRLHPDTCPEVRPPFCVFRIGRENVNQVALLDGEYNTGCLQGLFLTDLSLAGQVFPQRFHIPARKDRRNGFHIGVPGIQLFLLLLQEFHLFKGKIAFYLFLFHILLFPDEVLFKGLAHERGSRLAGILVQVDVTGASHHLILRSYSPRSGGFRLFFFTGGFP